MNVTAINDRGYGEAQRDSLQKKRHAIGWALVLKHYSSPALFMLRFLVSFIFRFLHTYGTGYWVLTWRTRVFFNLGNMFSLKTCHLFNVWKVIRGPISFSSPMTMVKLKFAIWHFKSFKISFSKLCGGEFSLGLNCVGSVRLKTNCRALGNLYDHPNSHGTKLWLIMVNQTSVEFCFSSKLLFVSLLYVL